MISLGGTLQALPFLIVIAFGYLIYLMYLRHKYAKEAEGCMWAEFFSKGGGSYGALCKEYRGIVEAPKGHEIGTYFITPDCSYSYRYPANKPKIVQTTIRRTVYIENNPIPRVSVDPGKWIEGKQLTEITAFLITTAANESFQKSALEMQKTFWGEISQIAKFVKNMPLALYASIGACAAAVITLYMVYMLYGFVVSRFG